MVELRHLRYFLAVAEENILAEPPIGSIWHNHPCPVRSSSWSTELGTLLLERTTRKVELTEAGDFAHGARSANFGGGRSDKERRRRGGRGAAGILRVGFAGTATYRLMPEIVRVARERMPLVRFAIRRNAHPANGRRLVGESARCRHFASPVRSSELSVDEIQQTRLVAVEPASRIGPGIRSREYSSIR